MSQKLVRKVLENTAAVWATASGLTVAWENVSFAPLVTAPYARSSLIPGRTISHMLDGSHRAYIGVYQITLVLPRNTGPKMLEDLASSLDQYFTTSAPLVDGSTKVFITNPMSVGPANPESDLYEVPVSCTYRSDFVA